MGGGYHCSLGLRGSPFLGNSLILSPRLQVEESHHNDDGVCPFEGLLSGFGGWDSETHPMCVRGVVSYLPREAGILSPLGMAVEDFTLGEGFYQGWD